MDGWAGEGDEDLREEGRVRGRRRVGGEEITLWSEKNVCWESTKKWR